MLITEHFQELQELGKTAHKLVSEGDIESGLTWCEMVERFLLEHEEFLTDIGLSDEIEAIKADVKSINAKNDSIEA